MSLTPAVERLSDALIMGLCIRVTILKLRLISQTNLESGEEATEA